MSILIKGMEMPKHAEGVCLTVTNFESCGSPVAMLVDRESILPKDFYDAIEIPTPHGRLIDADELKKNMRNYYPSIDHLCCSQHVVTKRDIDCAPTIIEVEVSE